MRRDELEAAGEHGVDRQHAPGLEREEEELPVPPDGTERVPGEVAEFLGGRPEDVRDAHGGGGDALPGGVFAEERADGLELGDLWHWGMMIAGGRGGCRREEGMMAIMGMMRRVW